MNLLYVVPFWPYLYTPWLFREAAWMRGRGHRVALISLGDPPGPQADMASFGLSDLPVLQVRRRFRGDRQLVGDLVQAAGQKGTTGATKLKAAVKDAGWRQGLHHWAFIRRILAFAREHEAQVIEAHWAAEAGDMARTIARALDLPYAVRLHGGDLYRPSPHLPRIIDDAAAICPVSAFLAALLRGERLVADLPVVPFCRVDADRLRICPNAIFDQSIAAAAVVQGDGQLVVGISGRIDPEKRHLDLIEALGQLARRFPNLRLRIIGGGSLEPALRKRAAELGIDPVLEITGALPADQVIGQLRQLHVYVQTSATEGFGVATLEAAGQGLPIVASRTGAHPEIVCDGRTGFIYEPGDVAALAGHLATLLGDRTLRATMGRAGLEHAREHFAFSRLMPRVEAILQAAARREPLPL